MMSQLEKRYTYSAACHVLTESSMHTQSLQKAKHNDIHTKCVMQQLVLTCTHDSLRFAFLLEDFHVVYVSLLSLRSSVLRSQLLV